MLTLLGIVAPAALMAWAVHRWLEPLPWRIVLFCIVVAVAVGGNGMFSGEVPVPLDEVVHGWPYRGLVGDVQSQDPLTNDTTEQILPWMAAVREEFAHGRSPLWNRYLFCGYPLLGNGQSAPFSPFFLATLFVPLPQQLAAMAGLKLFVALLFGYLLLRREGLEDGAALFGSAAFAFSVVNVCFLYYPLTAVTLLLPAAAYGAMRCAAQPGLGRTIVFAGIVAALLAGGHPESVVHVALAVVLLLAVDLATGGTTLRGLLRAAGATLAGALFAAPAWVPVLRQVLISLRLDLLKSGHEGASFPRTVLWGAVAPNGFGSPAEGNWHWYVPYPDVAGLYLGMIVLVLLVASVASRQATARDRLLLIAAVAVLLIALGWTPLARLAYLTPPLSWVAHERLRFVFAFFAAIIAARSLSRLRDRAMVAGLVASVAAAALFAYVYAHVNTLRPIAWAGVVTLGVFWAVLFVSRRHASAVAILLIVADLLVVTLGYNALTPARYFAPPLPIVDALKRAAPASPYRVLGLDWTFLPNAAAEYGLEDIRGSDPMEWARYARFFRRVEIPDASIDVKRVADPDQPLLDLMNVRFLLAPPGTQIGGKWRHIYSGVDGELFENTRALERFYSSSSAVQVRTTMETPVRFRVSVISPAAALIRSSQPAMPGWRATIDSRRLRTERSDDVFLAFWIPPGNSTVIVEYRDPAWLWALTVSALTLLIACVAVARGRHRDGGVTCTPCRP